MSSWMSLVEEAWRIASHLALSFALEQVLHRQRAITGKALPHILPVNRHLPRMACALQMTSGLAPFFFFCASSTSASSSCYIGNAGCRLLVPMFRYPFLLQVGSTHKSKSKLPSTICVLHVHHQQPLCCVCSSH
jgi:hypothetical protein